MKRILSYCAVAVLTALFVISCSPSEKEFNVDFLYGEWKSNQTISGNPYVIHDIFETDRTGISWCPTPDGETKDDGHDFRWSLSGETLTKVEKPGTGAEFPMDYTVTELTATTLKYTYLGTAYTWTKVK